MLSSVIKITERGAVPRKLQTRHTAAANAVWRAVGRRWHERIRPERFTPGFAERAGFTKRKGEMQPRGSKSFRRSYFGKKFLNPERGGGPGRADPLVFTGRTKDLTSATPGMTTTSTRVSVKYPGANTLKFRNPKSQVNMRKEFITVQPWESKELADVWDAEYERGMSDE